MSAPRNDNQRKRIYDAAIKLFAEQGYKGTTYSDIANACDVSKSIVQHYFPKKELLAENYFSEHLDALLKDVTQQTVTDPLHVICMIGLRHFNYMLNDQEMHQFNEDVIASRDLTNIIIEEEKRWAIDYLQREGDSSIGDALVCALGGAYELIYQGHKSGKHLDAEYIERLSFIPFAMHLGKSLKEAEAIIDECSLELTARR